MLNKIKKNVENELSAYCRRLEKRLAGRAIPSLITDTITDFIRRPGKRVRPILFVTSYLGLCRKPQAGVCASAAGLELLHDFLLIHDDIIDRTSLRKGQPTMHCLLQKKLEKHPRLKFTGSDLALVLADIIYALALEAFLGIREKPQRKLAALGTVLDTTMLTGCGEAVELLSASSKIASWKESDVYTVYDLKTAQYTFCSPLIAGAEMAGARAAVIGKLRRFGTLVGRGFQIRDDLLDLFASEKETGKTAFTDLREGKKTLLVWYAFRHADAAGRKFLCRALDGSDISDNQCRRIRDLIVSTGAADYARSQISSCRSQALDTAASLGLRTGCRKTLIALTEKILPA